MKTFIQYVALVALLSISYANCCSQENSCTSYLNCTPPPTDSAVVFAPGVVSLKNRYEEKICFSSNGQEVFFGIHVDPHDYFNPRILHSKCINGKWTTPDTASFSKNRKTGWPLSSLNGTILFMEEVTGKTETGVMAQIVTSKKINGSWSEPEAIHPDISAREGFGLAQVTNDSTFYFYDRYDRIAYYSKFSKGEYSKPIQLHYRINPSTEFCVSPNNDYIIFNPIIWSNNFHISFRKGENLWSMPIPLDSYFTNDKGWDGRGGGPSISPDGKYLFFFKKEDIYWIKTDFIEVLRKKEY